ncbi:NUDIX domain-containing protein [Geobacter sp.]|uniref:NUDIX domain-containing protein n=1 Tax=Geobacter sp. TaxID=46610 RepID=UPI002613B43B|nr:NUDIX domain-containing protein [Geobacter sp.]
MGKLSAGLLMYRFRGRQLEILLVHPGGPFWEKKDTGAWSIPKGEYAEEDPFETAKREFFEETGFEAQGEFMGLTPLRQASGKVVTAWAFQGECDAGKAKSNTFTMEWPPGSGKRREFPEVDRAAWFGVDEARKKILKGQIGFIDELCALLRHQDP